MLNPPYVSLGYTFIDLVQQRRAPPPADVVAAASDENLPAVRALFERWDADGDGQLSLPEFAHGLARSPDVRLVQPRVQWADASPADAQRADASATGADGADGGATSSPRRLDLDAAGQDQEDRFRAVVL